MTKKKRAKWGANVVLQMPTELDEESARFWPVFDNWPTAADVARFVDGTRATPDVRLNVLSGLRSYSATNIQPVWSFAAIWITLMALSTTIPTSLEWVRTAILVALVIVGLVVIGKLVDLSGDVDIRTRRAIVWLAAFEDGLRAEKDASPPRRPRRWWSRRT